MNGRCETCKMEESCGYEYKPCECRDYLKYKQKPVEQRHQCKSCGGFCKKSGCERKSIERELDTAFGLASCQGDSWQYGKAMIRYSHNIIMHGKALAACLSEGRPLSDSKYRNTFNFKGG